MNQNLIGSHFTVSVLFHTFCLALQNKSPFNPSFDLICFLLLFLQGKQQLETFLEQKISRNHHFVTGALSYNCFIGRWCVLQNLSPFSLLFINYKKNIILLFLQTIYFARVQPSSNSVHYQYQVRVWIGCVTRLNWRQTTEWVLIVAKDALKLTVLVYLSNACGTVLHCFEYFSLEWVRSVSSVTLLMWFKMQLIFQFFLAFKIFLVFLGIFYVILSILI